MCVIDTLDFVFQKEKINPLFDIKSFLIWLMTGERADGTPIGPKVSKSLLQLLLYLIVNVCVPQLNTLFI